MCACALHAHSGTGADCCRWAAVYVVPLKQFSGTTIHGSHNPQLVASCFCKALAPQHNATQRIQEDKQQLAQLLMNGCSVNDDPGYLKAINVTYY